MLQFEDIPKHCQPWTKSLGTLPGQAIQRKDRDNHTHSWWSSWTVDRGKKQKQNDKRAQISRTPFYKASALICWSVISSVVSAKQQIHGTSWRCFQSSLFSCPMALMPKKATMPLSWCSVPVLHSWSNNRRFLVYLLCSLVLPFVTPQKCIPGSQSKPLEGCVCPPPVSSYVICDIWAFTHQESKKKPASRPKKPTTYNSKFERVQKTHFS